MKKLQSEDEHDNHVRKKPESVEVSDYTDDELNSVPICFWVDTVCVPLSPESQQKSAIESMRSVYKRANRVLVL